MRLSLLVVKKQVKDTVRVYGANSYQLLRQDPVRTIREALQVLEHTITRIMTYGQALRRTKETLQGRE